MGDHEDQWKPWREKRYCFVPWCPNNDQDNPGKIFVYLRPSMKQEWCAMVGRTCPKAALSCCEDHLNLEEDLLNFDEVQQKQAKPKLKLTARLRNLHGGKGPGHVSNYRKKILTTQTSASVGESSSGTVGESSSGTVGESSSGTSVLPEGEEKCLLKYDVSVQCTPEVKNVSTNFKARGIKKTPSTHKIKEEIPSTSTSSPSIFGSSNIECQSSTSEDEEISQKLGRTHNLDKVKSKSKTYLGLPKAFYWLIEHIANIYGTSVLHLIITLYKIRTADTLLRISDDWNISRTNLQMIYHQNIVALASFFQNFIYLPNLLQIKKTLPFVFKIRYSNVQCIIDCFEIEINKPSNPLCQAQTWSNYKNCNTIKYLIASTPSGFISFVSKGYGGRISDKKLTEICGFIDILPLNAIIMADRGFKEIESILASKNVKLLRPPSVSSSRKPTKKEVIEGKVIASLRVHIERVIRRLRELKSLKLHAAVPSKHVRYLDDIVLIASGLCNLQEPIIKEY